MINRQKPSAALLKRFGLRDNGGWRKVPAVSGQYRFFWFNPDLDNSRVTICREFATGRWMVQ